MWIRIQNAWVEAHPAFLDECRAMRSDSPFHAAVAVINSLMLAGF